MKRNYPDQLTRHHRCPKKVRIDNSQENISIVKRKHHEMYHELFGSGTVEEVCNELNRIWIDYRYEIVFIKRKLKPK